MKALIKLHLKEHIRGKNFILFGILGGLVTLILLTGGEISLSNNPTEAIISQLNPVEIVINCSRFCSRHDFDGDNRETS